MRSPARYETTRNGERRYLGWTCDPFFTIEVHLAQNGIDFETAKGRFKRDRKSSRLSQSFPQTGYFLSIVIKMWIHKSGNFPWVTPWPRLGAEEFNGPQGASCTMHCHDNACEAREDRACTWRQYAYLRKACGTAQSIINSALKKLNTKRSRDALFSRICFPSPLLYLYIYPPHVPRPTRLPF